MSIHLLASLNTDEVAQLLNLSRAYKQRFGFVAEQVMAAADVIGIEPRIARMAIANECLMIAARFYQGDRESFVECARGALDCAKESS